MNVFYVYIYLDPRKPGSFDYGEFHFDFEPFYVGKGSKNQYLVHLTSDWKSYKTNKIRKIQSLGLQPSIIKYKENLTEQEAFDLEKKLIKTIGRLDLEHGPLTNLTDGGDGASGLSRESIEKQAKQLRGRTAATHSSVARQAEKIRGRTAANDLGRARQAEKMRGERNPMKRPEVVEKFRGRTAENDPGRARQAEKNERKNSLE